MSRNQHEVSSPYAHVYQLFDYDDALAIAINFLREDTQAREMLSERIEELFTHTDVDCLAARDRLSAYFEAHPLLIIERDYIQELAKSQTPADIIERTRYLILTIICNDIHILLNHSTEGHVVDTVFPASTRINARMDNVNYAKHAQCRDNRTLYDDFTALQRLASYTNVSLLAIDDIKNAIYAGASINDIAPTALLPERKDDDIEGDVEATKAWHIALWCHVLAQRDAGKPILIEFHDDGLRDDIEDGKQHTIRIGMRFLSAHPELIPDNVTLRCNLLDGFMIDKTILNSGGAYLTHLKRIIQSRHPERIAPQVPFHNPQFKKNVYTIKGTCPIGTMPLKALSSLLYSDDKTNPQMSHLSERQLRFFQPPKQSPSDEALNALYRSHVANCFVEQRLPHY